MNFQFRPATLFWGAVVLVVSLLGVGYCAGYRTGRREAPAGAAGKALEDRGARPAEVEKPKLEDTPPGAEPAFHVVATSGYGIDRSRGAQPSSAAGPTPGGAGQPSSGTSKGEAPTSPDAAGPVAEPLPPWPAAPDLACDCEVSSWWADGRLWVLPEWTARLQGPRGGTLLERSGKGEKIQAEAAPGFAPPRWRLDFLTGVAVPLPRGEGNSWDRLGLEAGLSWTGKRHGGYVLGEYTPPGTDHGADWRIHGGWRYSLK